jgi:hypothetical protein
MEGGPSVYSKIISLLAASLFIFTIANAGELKNKKPTPAGLKIRSLQMRIGMVQRDFR